MVLMNLGWWGSGSSLRLSLRIWTSMVRSKPSKSKPRAFSIIWARLKTLPGSLTKTPNSLNSIGVRFNGLSSRKASCFRKSTVIPANPKVLFRTKLEDTLKCAKLGLSLNPDALSSRNRQWNSEKRTWEYWKKRIPEVYAEAELIIGDRKAKHNFIFTCDICGKKFGRYKSNVRQGTIHNYCSAECRKTGDKTLRFAEKIQIQCSYCGKMIERSKLSIRKNNWCSISCKKKGLREQKKQQNPR